MDFCKHFSKHLSQTLTSVSAIFMCLLVMACDSRTAGQSVEAEKTKAEILRLNTEGEKARKNSRFDEAIKIHVKELELAKSINDTLDMVRALNNIGTNYRRLGILDDAVRYHQDALILTMRMEDQKEETVKKNRLVSLNGLGNIYSTLEDYEQADSIFRVALEGERELGSQIGQAINLANIGTVKEHLGQTDSAWIYYRYSLAMNKQAQSKLGEALCFSHIASLHEKEGKFLDAIEEYRHAYDVIADSPDDWHKLEAGINVAKLYIQQGDFPKAEEFLTKVNATACRIHSLEQRCKIHNLYYQLYEKKGDLRRALTNFIISTELQDSLRDIKKVNHIQDLRLNLGREQNRNLLDEARQRYQKERYVRNVLIVVLVVTILMAVIIIALLWHNLKKSKKANTILSQMNKSRENYFTNIAADPADLQSGENAISEQDRQFIGRFVDVVYSQMARGKTDVESIAELLSMNRTQLNRRIMAITGQNTQTYITLIRISKAKRLLRADINTPIGDIATKCGFDDVAYFSRIFKQQTNMTPSQYRKMV